MKQLKLTLQRRILGAGVFRLRIWRTNAFDAKAAVILSVSQNELFEQRAITGSKILLGALGMNIQRNASRVIHTWQLSAQAFNEAAMHGRYAGELRDQLTMDSTRGIIRARLHLNISIRMRAVRHWKENAEAHFRLHELTRLHNMVLASNNEMVVALMKKWWLGMNGRRKKLTLTQWFVNMSRDIEASMVLEHHLVLSSARDDAREAASEIANLKHQLLLAEGDLQDRQAGLEREKRNKEWAQEQMEKERLERIEQEGQQAMRLQDKLGELHYLKEVQIEHAELCKETEQLKQDLRIARMQNNNLQQALKDQEDGQREKASLKNEVMAGEVDRMRLKELETMYKEKEYSASRYKRELTAALLEVERLKDELSYQTSQTPMSKHQRAAANIEFPTDALK